MRRIAVLGSTGSLGLQTLELCERFRDRLQVVALGASGRRALKLAGQARSLRPAVVAVTEEEGARQVREALGREAAVAVISGQDALVEAAVHPDVDLVMVLTVGLAGLRPTLAALQAKKRVALANKEVLVAAGALFDAAGLVRAGRLLPVDSEHSAIWQCLMGEEPSSVGRLWLTASGGPFWGWDGERLRSVRPADALSHPTWQMGPRVTIDSATLMNKGFEVIEAHHLFALPLPQIQVVVHRQSVVHSLVEFVDGAFKAQLSLPDMRLPLLLAISHPARWPFDGRAGIFGPGAPATFTFERPPAEPRAVATARRAAAVGRTYPAVLSAADEVAVQAFLDGRLRFDRVLDVVESVLEAHEAASGPLSLDGVLEADAWARRAAAQELLRRLD